jgi:hypothetical protein
MKTIQSLTLFAIIFFCFNGISHAQITISGIVSDAETGETLPSANISIEGTYKGTITNVDGYYTLTVKDFPARIVVRFIGYETLIREINADSSPDQDFALKPSQLQLEEIVITGEDPAISIMKEVIRRKQIWRKKIDSYVAQAYTRQRLESDTSIVSISESISEAYWQKGKGHREIVKSRRQTANIEGSDNFAGVSYLPNFYDDDLDVSGFEVVGVTHPDALSYYNFNLVDYQKIDDQVVYEIKVSPKRKLQPLFEGTIYVLDVEYALLSVKLKPNRVVDFPPPVQDFDLDYEQQFNNYGKEFWLPADIRINGRIKIGIIGLRFPPIQFSQISRISDYEVNVDLPDTLFKGVELFSVDSTTIDDDSLFVNSIDVVPLSKQELDAYENLDSTATLEKAFRPTGFLARFINDDDEDEGGYTISSNGGGISEAGATDSTAAQPQRKEPGVLSKTWNVISQGSSLDARFNRVDLLYVGWKYRLNMADNRLRTESLLGYSTGYEEVSYGGKISWWPLPKTRRLALSAEYNAVTGRRFDDSMYNFVTNFVTLLGRTDYFDYYRREGMAVNAAYRFRRRNLTLRTSLVNELHTSIDFKSSYNVIGRDIIQRVNPEIDEGWLRSTRIQLESLDGNEETFGVLGSRGFTLSAEFSGDYLGSDFSFSRYDLNVLYNFNTFFQRRIFPNTMDMRLMAGTSTGELPLQLLGSIDGSSGNFTPFGVFKTRRGLPYEGEHYAAVYAEHNFRTVPFELLGLNWIVDQGIGMIAFGGVGQTWISDSRQQEFTNTNGTFLFETDGVHAEAGLSINSLFSIARLDFAKRLDTTGFYVGFSVARWF